MDIFIPDGTLNLQFAFDLDAKISDTTKPVLKAGFHQIIQGI